MGKILVEKILPVLSKTNWPESQSASELGRQSYELGLDKVDEYYDDPKTLASAIRIFQSGDSQPFAFAGIAYTLLKAAREKDGSYAENGLMSSLEWLENAQNVAPDIVEINMVEAFIYIYGGRFDDARLILDYLENLEAENYYLMRAEGTYWEKQGEIDKAVQWYSQAIEAAETVPRKLRLRVQMGDCYFRDKQYEEALTVYDEAIHFSPKNAHLLHKMSLAYWGIKDYEEAAYYNRRTLKVEPDFPEAIRLKEALDKKNDGGGITKRLFGR
jgi:tetratricopeptide (TPR) repeat protein